MSDSFRRMIWFCCILTLATATSACMGLRWAPRFGALRAEDRPFQFRHDIQLYTAANGMTVALVPDRRTNRDDLRTAR